MKRNPTAERIKKRIIKDVKFRINFYLANGAISGNRNRPAPLRRIRPNRFRPGRRKISIAKINHIIDKLFNHEADTLP